MTENINHAERAHALLSASSSARWLACPPSAVAAEAYPQQDTPFTREGTLAHEVAEAVVRQRLFQPDLVWRDTEKDVTDEMIDCANGYADYIQEQIKDSDAVILLEQQVDFSPWVPEGFGTADCLIFQGDTMDVVDYKFGRGQVVSAEDNPQLKLYGLGAWYDYGFVYDIKNVRLHIYQPRINNISTYSLTVDELATWGVEIVRPTAEKAAKGEGEHTPGVHCTFCPHAGRCRALTDTCTEYVRTHGMESTVPVLAPWEVAEVLRMEPLISLWLKRVKDQALNTLLNGGEVPGYKVVEGKMGNRKWSDELKVAEVLRKAGYSHMEITETKLLGPAGMDKAIGKKRVAELLTALIDRSPGAPTVVREEDNRPKYDPAAETLKDLNG